MGRRLSAEYGFGSSLACKDCHTPDPNGVRFEPVDMKEDCSMCHSLAFDEIGGTVRTLRHGEPAMVQADLRAYYRSTGPTRPINLGGMNRPRPTAICTMAGSAMKRIMMKNAPAVTMRRHPRAPMICCCPESRLVANVMAESSRKHLTCLRPAPCATIITRMMAHPGRSGKSKRTNSKSRKRRLSVDNATGEKGGRPC